MIAAKALAAAPFTDATNFSAPALTEDNTEPNGLVTLSAKFAAKFPELTASFIFPLIAVPTAASCSIDCGFAV